MKSLKSFISEHEIESIKEPELGGIYKDSNDNKWTVKKIFNFTSEESKGFDEFLDEYDTDGGLYDGLKDGLIESGDILIGCTNEDDEKIAFKWDKEKGEIIS